jgi:glycosyltransferase involved in cell wall biosynthesis
MIRLLEDIDFRNSLGKEASKLIRDNFSWEAIADHHIAFYKKYC